MVEIADLTDNKQTNLIMKVRQISRRLYQWSLIDQDKKCTHHQVKDYQVLEKLINPMDNLEPQRVANRLSQCLKKDLAKLGKQ